MIRYLLSKNRNQQAAMFLIVVLATLAALIPIHLFRMVIDRVIPTRDYHLLGILTVVLVVVLLLSAGLEYLKAVQARRIQEFFIADLRFALMSRLMDLPAEYFSGNPVGKLINRIMHDVSRFGMGIEWLLVNPAISLATIGIYSMYLISINPTLTVLAILPLPLVIFASSKISAALSRHRNTVMDAASNYSASVNEVILAATEIQSNGTYRKEQARLTQEHRTLSEAGIHEASLLARISTVSSSYRDLVPILVYCYGAWMALAGHLSVGSVVAFSAAFAGLYFAIDTLINYMPMYQNVRDRYAELQKILNEKTIGPALDNLPETAAPITAPTVIQLQGVSFCHTSGATIINQLTTSIQPGEHIALIGRSGCGKSTLMNLLAGRLQPFAGRIAYGDIEHTQLSSAQRVGLISYVQQAPFLFTGTLKDNLLYGVAEDQNINISNADLVRACAGTGLDADLLTFGLEARLSPSTAQPFAAIKNQIAQKMGASSSSSAASLWDEQRSIRDNLAPADYDADNFSHRKRLTEAMLETLSAEGLADRLRALGLDFEVGERGSRLSGGQKQKVSITRALLRKRPILLLDEVTASLDEASAKTVIGLLKTELRDVTVIAITHELDSIAAFDRVIALKDGEIYADDAASTILNNRSLLQSLLDRNPVEPS